MTATVVIPARLASTRFPEKILASETGRPLVQHVVDRVRLCRNVREIIVAADDERIVTALRAFQTRCVLTSPRHQSGTDRVAEVARNLPDEIIVNVQADEPEIDPQIVDSLIERLHSSDDDMATAATQFPPAADANDPNLVKVVTTPAGRALYFSRSAIPFHRDGTSPTNPTYHLHLGIYAYPRQFLLEFAAWPATPLELSEKLEQLRALEHGRKIQVLMVEIATHGIDTPRQYADFVNRWKQNQ